MDYPYAVSFLPIFLVLLFIFLTQRNQRVIIKNILKKRKTEAREMFTLAQKFIGKECLIYTFNSQITGIIKEVNEGGILLQNKETEEVLNFDFIVRIREYPRTKSGKKKSVVLD